LLGLARSRATSLILTLLVLAAGAALGATPAEAGPRAKKAIWGSVLNPDGSSAFRYYRDLGVKYFQIQLRWDLVAPQRPRHPTNPNDPAYQWPTALDIAHEKTRGGRMRVAVMIKGSPPWANSGRGAVWAPRGAAFADFLTAVARRYPAVRHWMIWGETNRAAVFQPLPLNSPAGPRRYATLLKTAYTRLKRLNKHNLVIGGMTFTFGEVMPRDFLRWMRLPNGKPPPLDLFGHNPFSRRFPNIRDGGYAPYPASRDMSDIDRYYREIHRTYRRAYRRFRNRGPYLWLSEFTVSSDRPSRAFTFAVTREEQARWLTAAYRIAYRKKYVKALGWFNLRDEDPTRSGALTNGLLAFDGSPKPAYHAYKRLP
jgi:hypothetical protein